MKLKKFLLNNFYSYAATLLISIFALAIICELFKLDYNPFAVFTISCITIALISVIDYFKKKIYTYIVIGSAIIFVSIVCLILRFNTFRLFYKSFDWLWYYDGTKEDYKFIYAYIAIASMLIIILVVCYVFQKWFASRIGLAIIILGTFIYFGFKETMCSKLIIFCGIFYMVLILIEMSVFFSYKSKNEKDRKIVIQTLLPVVLIISIFTNMLPVSSEPIKWQLVKNVIHNIQTMVSNVSYNFSLWYTPQNGEYNIGMAGFSDNGEIGGNIQGLENQQFTAKFDFKPYSGVYLTGAISDTYNGRGWSKNAENIPYDLDEHTIDYFELIYAFQRAGISENVFDVLTSREVTVFYNGIETKSLFYPLKTNSEIDSKDNKFDGRFPNIIFDKPNRKSTEYKLSYFELNQSSKIFKNLLDKEQNYKYDKNITLNSADLSYKLKYVFNHLPQSVPDNFEDILSKRAEQIRKDYLQVPENLPQRVKDLSSDVTKNFTSDYEKLKAIEKYLNNYTYTLTPGSIPKDRDAVDYFLFDKKEGYCTYFASSMAVMARCAGIPTRYVQGFALNQENQNGYATYDFKGKNAHAWVEAYIEGIGWIPFEPTSTYKSNRDFKMYKNDYNPPANVKGYIPDHDVKDDTPTDTDILQNETTKKNNTPLIIFIISASVIVMIIASIAGYIITQIRKKKKKYKDSDNNAKLMIDFKLILILTQKLVLKLSDGETISSYSDKITELVRTDDVTFADITKIYMKARYGDKKISDKDLRKVVEIRELMKGKAKENFGKMKYWLFILKH